MVQTENRFLPDPCLEMETETKALSCFLQTTICVCVCVCVCASVFCSFKHTSQEKYLLLCYVGRWHSCFHGKLKYVRACTFNNGLHLDSFG